MKSLDLATSILPIPLAIVGMKVFVPRSERRTFEQVERGERRAWTLAGRLARRGVTPEQMRRGDSS